MKAIIYTRPDGGVSVTHLAKGASVDEARQRIPEGVTDIHVIDASELPRYDSATRNQWEIRHGRVYVRPTT
jgi:hypothetical protein